MPDAAKPNNAKVGCLTIIVIVVVVGVIAAVIGGGSKHSTTYTAKIAGISVLDPAEVNVQLSVTNKGSNSATPSCTVNISSPGGAYTGVDIFTPTSPLAAGASTGFNGNITVTNQGATYVDESDSTVTCK